MMVEKRLNLFDECDTRCVATFVSSGRRVHLISLRGAAECTDSIASSQTTLTETNKTGAIAKVRALVEQVIL